MDDFEQRVLKCDTLKKIEQLHERVIKFIPASQRGEYIDRLNLREDFISRDLYRQPDYDKDFGALNDCD